MTVTLATLSAITKEIYQGDLREQLNNDVVGLRRIERSGSGITSEVGGKYVTFPIHYGRNGGIGARRELEDLPIAGNQGTAAARIGLKYQYGSVALSGQSLELADSNTQAFLSALDLEVNGLKTDLAKNLNREVYGNGNGQMGTTTTVGASTTAVINSGLQYFNVGDIVDVFTPANLLADSTAKASGLTVTAIVASTATITVSSSVTFASGDVFVRAGSANREWTGLGAICNNSGILYNVDPATVDKWRAYVNSNAGTPRALTESLILNSIDAVRVAGGKTSLMLTTLGVRRSYFGLLVQNRSFVNTTQENKSFEGGFYGLAFTTDAGEVPIIADVDATTGTMYGLSESNIKMYRESDWSFMDRDGSMWLRLAGAGAGTIKDAYGATMCQYSELGTDRRNVHFRLADLIEA